MSRKERNRGNGALRRLICRLIGHVWSRTDFRSAGGNSLAYWDCLRCEANFTPADLMGLPEEAKEASR